jgi:hypothetical protein
LKGGWPRCGLDFRRRNHGDAHRLSIEYGARGSVMPKNLKRYYGCGDLHFVTFSCYRRIPLLRTIGARNEFVKALGAISFGSTKKGREVS